MMNKEQKPQSCQTDVIWRCLSDEIPLPNRIIEIEVDSKFWQIEDKTIITKTLPHHHWVLIRIDGHGGFFRAKPTEEFNQSLKWRYNDL